MILMMTHLSGWCDMLWYDALGVGVRFLRVEETRYCEGGVGGHGPAVR